MEHAGMAMPAMKPPSLGMHLHCMHALLALPADSAGVIIMMEWKKGINNNKEGKSTRGVLEVHATLVRQRTNSIEEQDGNCPRLHLSGTLRVRRGSTRGCATLTPSRHIILGPEDS